MSKNINITVVGYPSTFSFVVDKPLPAFKYGCEVRRKLLQEAMELQQIESPFHEYDDYVVEEIDVTPNGDEHWHLGS